MTPRKAITASSIPVPRLPEVIEAEARKKWRGDPWKVATTSIDKMIVRGVEITSRYNKADEFDLMAHMICALPQGLCGLVKAIWCDSKASSCFSVLLHERAADLAHGLIQHLHEAALAHNGGHNGIYLSANDDGGPPWGPPYVAVHSEWTGDLWDWSAAVRIRRTAHDDRARDYRRGRFRVSSEAPHAAAAAPA